MKRFASLFVALMLIFASVLPVATISARAACDPAVDNCPPPPPIPYLNATPSLVKFGSFHTAIAYQTDGSTSAVCVTHNGATSLLTVGNIGNVGVDFINSGQYVFTLRSGSSCAGATTLTAVVNKLTPDGTTNASLLVSPTEFPVVAGAVTRTSAVSFDTGDDTTGAVYVSVNGAPEVLFTRSTYGTVNAAFIQSGLYIFRFVKGAATAGSATVRASAGLVAANPNPPTGGSTVVTGNTGDGTPALICISTPDKRSIPLTLGNSGVANASFGGVPDGTYTAALYTSVNGSAISSPTTGTGGAACGANTPLKPSAMNGPLVIVVGPPPV